MMIFIFIPIFSGLLNSICDVLCKVYIKRNERYSDSFFVLFLRWFLSLPLLFPFLFWEPKITITKDLIIIYIFSIPLEILAAVLYMESIKISDLSFVSPFQSLTPVFLLLTGFLFLGERTTSLGFSGVFLIFVGGYIINLQGRKFYEPILGLFKDRGVVLMCVTSIIYSITVVFGKKATVMTNPEFFGSSYMYVMTAAMLPSFIKRYGRMGIKELFNIDKIKIGIGLTMLASVLTHFIALKYIPTSYMISLKRTSILFAVILGRIFLDEGNLRKRLIGAVFMLSGAMIISFSYV